MTTTTTQAAYWQQRRQQHIDQHPITAGELAWDDLDRNTSLEALIRHAAVYGDAWIANDFNVCLLPVASPEDRPALIRYSKARMAHKDFKRRDYLAKHAPQGHCLAVTERNIPKRQPVPAPAAIPATGPIPWCTCDGCKFQRRNAPVEPARSRPVPRRVCKVCGGDMAGKRRDAQTNSKACRLALARSKARAA